MPNSAITQQVQGLATTTSPGLVGTGAQTFGGAKTFQDGIVAPSTAVGTVYIGAAASSTTIAFFASVAAGTYTSDIISYHFTYVLD